VVVATAVAIADRIRIAGLRALCSQVKIRGCIHFEYSRK